MIARLACAAAALLMAQGAAAVRHPSASPDSYIDPAVMQIEEEKHLGVPLRGDLGFVDADGRQFTLAQMLGKPVILLMSYYTCDGSCPTMNENLRRVLEKVGRFRAGSDYRVLTVSFDRNDTRETASAFVAKANIPESMRDGWRHAVLQAPETGIETLAGSIGFRYFWSERDRTFLHPNVAVFVTPTGRIARYLYGMRLEPQAVELALIDADWERIANSMAVFDMISGVCYSFNFAEGKYQLNYPLLAGVGSLLLGVALMAGGLIVYRRKTRGMSHVQ